MFGIHAALPRADESTCRSIAVRGYFIELSKAVSIHRSLIIALRRSTQQTCGFSQKELHSVSSTRLGRFAR